LRASVPVLRAIDLFVKTQQTAEQVNKGEVVTLLVDNLAFTSSASTDMNFRRADPMRNELNQDNVLCS
jgi:hypothetical protein